MKTFPQDISQLDIDCIEQYEKFMGIPFDSYEQYQKLDSFLDFMILDIDRQKEFEKHFVWLCAYRDTLGLTGDEDDNLCEILMPVKFLTTYLKSQDTRQINDWLNDYTADSVEPIIHIARGEGIPMIINVHLKGDTHGGQSKNISNTGDNGKIFQF